jgi:hypothetical protein
VEVAASVGGREKEKKRIRLIGRGSTNSRSKL